MYEFFCYRRHVLLIHDFWQIKNEIPARIKKVTPRSSLKKPLNQKENTLSERETYFVVMDYIVVFILVLPSIVK